MAMATLTVDGLEIPADVHTLEGFRAWVASLGERAPRVCFSGGEVFVEMSPQSYHGHGYAVAEINAVLTALARELDLGRYCTPPSWFTCAEAGLSVEPDGFLVRFASFESGRFRIDPEREFEGLGRPDMVLEAVSRTSERKDRVTLRERYALAGVREYWLVDARGADPTLEVLVLTGAAYAPQPTDDDGWVRSPVWSRAFRLVRRADRVGQPDYRLEVRPGR